MENDINIMPPIQPEPTPVQPAPNPEGSFIKKNFTPEFVAIIVGLLILGGAAYGYATYLAKKNFNEVTRLAEEGRKQEEELRQKRLDNSSKIADWQTYRNEEYGFEARYPIESVQIILDEVIERGTVGVPGFRMNTGGHFAIGVWDNKDGLSMRRWLDKQYFEYSGGWIWDYQEEMLGNNKVGRAINSGDCYIEWVIFSQGNKIYTFGLEICGNNRSESLNTFNLILSTFKFIK